MIVSSVVIDDFNFALAHIDDSAINPVKSTGPSQSDKFNLKSGLVSCLFSAKSAQIPELHPSKSVHPLDVMLQLIVVSEQAICLFSS